jgi:2'-5' RNA ligase
MGDSHNPGMQERGPDSAQAGGGPALVRAFIALELTEDVRSRLMGVVERLRRLGAHVSWVPRQNLHISLVFLGNITREAVDAVTLVLDETAAHTPRVSLDVNGVGAFGSRSSPRVIWAGAGPVEPLRDLHAGLVGRLQDLAVPFDRKPMRPHVTLGRVRSARGRQALAAALPQFERAAFGHVDVEGVALMRSELLPGGARYAPLHRAAFRG